MGGVGGMLGLAGGAGGTGFAAPSTGNIVGQGELDATNKQANDALAQQAAFTQAVNPGGQLALNSQQQLLSQLGQAAQGQGPNPALAQLNQTTGQNTANQAALMAGQRGASQNAGLIARQAAQQGAANQQQAAGQAATMEAQQQIAARQALQAQQAQMVGQQAGATNAQTGSALQQQLGLNQTAAGLQANVNQANTAMAGNTMGLMSGIVSPLAGGASSGAASAAMAAAEGGKVNELPKMADGGSAGPQSEFGQYLLSNSTPQQTLSTMTSQNQKNNLFNAAYNLTAPTTTAPTTTGTATPWETGGEMAGGPNDTMSNAAPTSPGAGVDTDRETAAEGGMMAEGGKVPALVSPGEVYLKPHEVEKVKKGANPMKTGEKIPGKPKVGGAVNSYANDTVRKTLDEGGIVIPRSITQGPNAHWNAMKFVHQTLKKGK